MHITRALCTLWLSAVLFLATTAVSAEDAKKQHVRVLVPQTTAALPFLLMASEGSAPGLELTVGFFANHAQALALLDRSLLLAPDDTAVLSNRALALEALARPREAAQAWSRIAALAAGTPLGDRALARARSLTRD